MILGVLSQVRAATGRSFRACVDREDASVAAANSAHPDRWWTGFGHLLDRIGGRFTRHEPRRPAAALMLGLLSDLDRKNCWSIAEDRGAKTPDALQHLLSRSVWKADLIRDDLCGYVVDPGATRTPCWWLTRPKTTHMDGLDGSRQTRPAVARTRPVAGRRLPEIPTGELC